MPAPGPQGLEQFPIKAASKMLSRLAAGKVSMSFLAPTQPGRKASPAHLFPFCIHPHKATLASEGQASLTLITLFENHQTCKGWRGKGWEFCVSEIPTGLRRPPA